MVHDLKEQAIVCERSYAVHIPQRDRHGLVGAEAKPVRAALEHDVIKRELAPSIVRCEEACRGVSCERFDKRVLYGNIYDTAGIVNLDRVGVSACGVGL